MFREIVAKLARSVAITWTVKRSQVVGRWLCTGGGIDEGCGVMNAQD